jgi:glycine C-acetyltransferase
MEHQPLEYLKKKNIILKDQNLFTTYRSLESAQLPHSIIDGKEVINLSSNNYLGLTYHPKLKKAAIEAIKTYGVGVSAGRVICGNLDIHNVLERCIAEFKGTESALSFQTGYGTNLGFIPAIIGEEDAIVSDELNHASIIDGSRMSRAKIYVYRHADPNSAEEQAKIALNNGARRLLMATDGVFSMDGDIAPLPELVGIARQYGAITMVDDAHGVGVLGKNGRGVVSHFGLEGKVDVIMGTFSKAIGVMGGYITGPEHLIDWLKNRHRPSFFSSSTQTPAAIAATIAALEVLVEEPERIKRLWNRTNYFRQGLIDLGFSTGKSQTPIIPIIVGESEKTNKLSQRLFDEGVLATAVTYPIVARDQARLRTIMSSELSLNDIDQALEIIGKVSHELGIL